MAGLSGLALTGPHSELAQRSGGRPGLLALTDSGAIVELPRPGEGRIGWFRDLPDGPGYPNFRLYRDSEAVVAEGDSLLVTFETRHSLWRFGHDGGIARMRLPARGWSTNKGVEAMVRDRAGRLLLMPEASDWLLRLTPGRGLERIALEGRTGGIAEATRLPDGRIIVAVREVDFGGLTNRLAWLEAEGAGYRLRPVATLPLGLLDNVEGLVAEPGPDGSTTLWAVTDDDGWRRSLMLRMEIAPSR